MLLNLTYWAFNGVIFSINTGCFCSCKIYKKKKKWNRTLKVKTKTDPLATGGIFVVAMASPSRGAFFTSFFQAVWVSHGVRSSVHGLCCCALKLQVIFGGSSEGHARFWKHPSTPPFSPLRAPTSNTQTPLPTNVWNRAKQGPNIYIYVHVYIHRCALVVLHSDIQVKEIYHCGSTSTSRCKSRACKFDKTRSKSSWE